MKTATLVALLCNAPQKGERLIAIAPPGAALLAADAKPDAPLPADICWMPRGDHEISANTMHGSTWTGLVRCDELGASVVIASFDRARAAGKRVWLDLNHDDGAAAADVRGFSWDPARGIVAKVDWTPHGEKALREKLYSSFSPAFWVDWESGRVSGLVEGHAAGGLVNAPAFGAAMPALIAARLGGAESTNSAPGGSSGNQTTNTTMNREMMMKILAALAVTVPANSTDEQVTALFTQHVPINANAANAAREIAQLREQLTALQTAAAKPEDHAAIKAMKATLDALVASAKAAQKKRGEEAIQAAVDRGAIKAEDADTRATMLEIFEHDEGKATKLLASMPGKPTAQSVVVVPDVTQRGAAVIAQVTREDFVTALKAYAAEKDPKKRTEIYASSVSPIIRDRKVIMGPILAANALGTLSGDLAVQRALTLLKLTFPELNVISTDFSAEGAKLNQQIVSRIKSVPTVSNYVAGTGYTTSDATTTDVPVTISNHKGVELSFNANELSSSERDLFGEQSEGAHYSLGKALVDAIYAVITVANFPEETVSTEGDFNRSKMQALRKALNGRMVPGRGRFALLNEDFADKLGQDSSLVSLATFQRPEIITEGTLPRVSGFQPFEAGNLPTAESLVGFAGTAEALVIATRTPADYAQDGSIQFITNPDTGITVQLVRFVDHKKGASYWRIALMFGAAKGNADCGQRLVHTANA